MIESTTGGLGINHFGSEWRVLVHHLVPPFLRHLLLTEDQRCLAQMRDQIGNNRCLDVHLGLGLANLLLRNILGKLFRKPAVAQQVHELIGEDEIMFRKGQA